MKGLHFTLTNLSCAKNRICTGDGRAQLSNRIGGPRTEDENSAERRARAISRNLKQLFGCVCLCVCVERGREMKKNPWQKAKGKWLSFGSPIQRHPPSTRYTALHPRLSIQSCRPSSSVPSLPLIVHLIPSYSFPSFPFGIAHRHCARKDDTIDKPSNSDPLPFLFVVRLSSSCYTSKRRLPCRAQLQRAPGARSLPSPSHP